MTTTTARVIRTTVATAALSLLLLGALAGCKKEAAPVEAAPVAQLPAPKGTDDKEWQAYLNQEIGKHMKLVTDRQYTYYLSANSDAPDTPDGSSMYSRQLENVTGVVQRTVLPGNMLAFGSPDSAKMGDLLVAAFTGAAPDALKGSSVVFVGDAADNARVKPVVEASGANYIFVEAK
jgi:hypothetical protein